MRRSGHQEFVIRLSTSFITRCLPIYAPGRIGSCPSREEESVEHTHRMLLQLESDMYVEVANNANCGLCLPAVTFITTIQYNTNESDLECTCFWTRCRILWFIAPPRPLAS